MPFAIAGKILHVDLSTKKTWSEPIPEGWTKHFIGARGINAKILWDSLKGGIDPFGPDNILIFGTGPLTGRLHQPRVAQQSLARAPRLTFT